ncbi:MAG: DUF4838 domain-containing protein [bacterium]
MTRFYSLGGILFPLILFTSACTSQQPQGLVLVRGEPSQLRIILADDAGPPVQYAAEELQRFLEEISGVDLPIVSEPKLRNSGALVIADALVERDLQALPDIGALGTEGYVLRTVGDHLLIVGGQPRGTLYGVYGLLEDKLGCRWFTSEVSRIPQVDRLEIPPLDETVLPTLEYREPFVKEALDPDWAVRNRVNGHFLQLEEKHGGKVAYQGFVHTYDALVPPDQYFDEHPEYFSLVNGKRLKYRSQLCNTNPGVAAVVIEEVRRLMREHPEATVFSVSQNDWHNFCQCETCTALAEEEGTQAAPILYLVNQVARAVRDEFPDKLIDTLAYAYSRKPPKSMQPEPNVIVRLCSIECCFAHPFTECTGELNKAFVEDVVGWSRICKRLWVWDYVTSFSHYLTPFPNLHVRAPNIRFLVAHNVRGIFEQDVYNTLDGEFSALSGYLGAKLLWNPDADAEEIMEEFVEGVYGDAAPHILRYIDALQHTTDNPNLHSEVWDGPDAPYITDDFLARADGFWQAAEAAVAGEPEVLSRVQVARMPVDYAILEHARFVGLRTLEPAPGTPWGVRIPPALSARVERFFRTAEASKLVQIREHGETIAEYKAEWISLLAAPAKAARPAVKVTSPKPGLRYGYYEGRWIKLPEFDEISPEIEGVTSGVSLDVSPAEMSYGLRFEGYFKAPETGLYCFTLVSNDGSRMIVDGEILIDHDVRHMAIPCGNLIALEAGYHPIIVEYFQSAGRKYLEFFGEGPGLSRQLLSADLLRHSE